MAFFHNPPYVFHDKSYDFRESTDYGVSNYTKDGIKLIADGYTTLNYQGAGITQLYNGVIHSLFVPINKPFMVFTRASTSGGHSLLLGIMRNGTGYDVYTIGQCEVFIFTDDIESNTNNGYGINIYNRQGSRVMHSVDQSIKIIHTGHINTGQTWTWPGSGKRKFAYNYLGSGGDAIMNVAEKHINIERDFVECNPNSFTIRRINWKGNIPISGNSIVGTDIVSNASNSYLTRLISNPNGLITIIDVTDLKYDGMSAITNY